MILSTLQSSLTPPIIAHRGASAYAPENTLAAFLKAKQLGFNWVEFDVLMTHTGDAIVFHDHDLARTTNGAGMVESYSYDYLKTLDAGSWFDPLFSDQSIPLLKDVLHLLHGQHLAANLEIKSGLKKEQIAVQRVFEVLQENAMQLPSPLLISSFSREVLRTARKISSTALLGLLFNEWQEDWNHFAEEVQCISIHANQALLTQAKAAEIKEKGYLLLSHTVNDTHRAKELLSWGVDAVFSNCPAVICDAFCHSR